MSFFAELKRRNAYRATVFYAATGMLHMQITTQVQVEVSHTAAIPAGQSPQLSAKQ
jgi:hypothetical protein